MDLSWGGRGTATRPAAGRTGPHRLPPPIFHSPHPPPDVTASVMKSSSRKPGKSEKRTRVRRARNLCGLTGEKTRPCARNELGGCGDSNSSMEMKPHAYFEAIWSGLGDVATGSSDGNSHFGDACVCLHGDVCEICRLQVLHPFDPEQRKMHEKLIMATFEHDLEKALAFQASQEKVCSICMEVVYEKPSASERRFGILSNCSHTYCLSCIRRWRFSKQFENPIIKSCPECGVISEFVIPSVYWVEDQKKKNELIEAFKQGMGEKACKYFEQYF
uniref:RING-type E3 ubiquitin transferase n=1 Tax=Sarcophilus harrisii TaxID=9305 RepID=G3WTM3_SARHA